MNDEGMGCVGWIMFSWIIFAICVLIMFASKWS